MFFISSFEIITILEPVSYLFIGGCLGSDLDFSENVIIILFLIFVSLLLLNSYLNR